MIYTCTISKEYYNNINKVECKFASFVLSPLAVLDNNINKVECKLYLFVK